MRWFYQVKPYAQPKLWYRIHKESRPLRKKLWLYYRPRVLRRLREVGGTIAFASILTWGGDYVLQELYEAEEPFDKRRSSAFLMWGALMGGWGYTWYHWMRHVPLIRQVALYQLCISPVEYIGFYSFIGAAEGESWSTIKQEISDKIIVTQLSDWAVYTPAMMFIVKYVPVQLRAVADNSFSFLWSVFLSFLKHHDVKAPPWWTEVIDFMRLRVEYQQLMKMSLESSSPRCVEESSTSCSDDQFSEDFNDGVPSESGCDSLEISADGLLLDEPG